MASAEIAGRNGIRAVPGPDRPTELLELTSSRGFAAFAVLFFHVHAYSGRPLEAWFPVERLGMLAVDFFFVLSGFVLAHVYGAAFAEGRYDHLAFVIRRFARIWPMHFACHLGVGAIVAAGTLVGLRPPWPVEASTFVAHVLMLNATGFWPQLSWNQPSWSIGAEWTAYLTFPLYLAVCSAITPSWAKLAAAACLLVGLHVALKAKTGLDLLALDANGGVLRIVPSFFAGVALRQIYGRGVGAGLPTRALSALLGATTAFGLTLLALGASALAVWPVLIALIYLLALRAGRTEAGALRSRPLVWLGEVSYGLYLVHAPVLMVTFGIAAKLLGVAGTAALLATGAVAVVLALCAAAVAHYTIERPAQAFILRRADRLIRRPAEPSSA